MAIASWLWILWRHFVCIGAKVHFIFSMKFCIDLTARTTGMRDTSDRCVFNCSTADRSATVGCFYNNSVDFCQSWMGLKHLRRWKQFPVNLLSLKSIPWWFNVTFFCALAGGATRNYITEFKFYIDYFLFFIAIRDIFGTTCRWRSVFSLVRGQPRRTCRYWFLVSF